MISNGHIIPTRIISAAVRTPDSVSAGKSGYAKKIIEDTPVNPALIHIVEASKIFNPLGISIVLLINLERAPVLVVIIHIMNKARLVNKSTVWGIISIFNISVRTHATEVDTAVINP